MLKFFHATGMIATPTRLLCQAIFVTSSYWIHSILIRYPSQHSCWVFYWLNTHLGYWICAVSRFNFCLVIRVLYSNPANLFFIVFLWRHLRRNRYDEVDTIMKPKWESPLNLMTNYVYGPELKTQSHSLTRSSVQRAEIRARDPNCKCEKSSFLSIWRSANSWIVIAKVTEPRYLIMRLDIIWPKAWCQTLIFYSQVSWDIGMER